MEKLPPGCFPSLMKQRYKFIVFKGENDEYWICPYEYFFLIVRNDDYILLGGICSVVYLRRRIKRTYKQIATYPFFFIFLFQPVFPSLIIQPTVFFSDLFPKNLALNLQLLYFVEAWNEMHWIVACNLLQKSKPSLYVANHKIKLKYFTKCFTEVFP